MLEELLILGIKMPEVEVEKRLWKLLFMFGKGIFRHFNLFLR